jgi:hypothetical protein
MVARMLPQAVSDHYRAQQRLTVATLALTRREWATMGDDFDSSWARVGPRLALLTASAQVGAARSGASYIPASLAETGAAIEPVGTVVPEALAGIASDGRPLDTLLYGAVVRAREADVDSLAERLTIGGAWLDMAVHTTLADTARQAASVAIAARPKTGWIRMVNPPCCKRCAVQAGRIFKWNQGFQRHPRCDCRHIPYAESDPFDPGINIGPQDVKDLTIAQRRAISDGADMNQVINSDRGRSANRLYTTEGTTRSGWASHVRRELAKQRGEVATETATNAGRRGAVQNYIVRRTGPRPTPEAIYKFADSREEAIKLLAANGYIVADMQTIARLAR